MIMTMNYENDAILLYFPVYQLPCAILEMNLFQNFFGFGFIPSVTSFPFESV